MDQLNWLISGAGVSLMAGIYTIIYLGNWFFASVLFIISFGNVARFAQLWNRGVRFERKSY